METSKKEQSQIVAKVEYSKTYNLGNYSSRKITISLEGPFDELSNRKELPRLLWPVGYNCDKVCDKIHSGEIPPKSYDETNVQDEKLYKGKPVQEKKKKESKKKEIPDIDEEDEDEDI